MSGEESQTYNQQSNTYTGIIRKFPKAIVPRYLDFLQITQEPASILPSIPGVSELREKHDEKFKRSIAHDYNIIKKRGSQRDKLKSQLKPRILDRFNHHQKKNIMAYLEQAQKLPVIPVRLQLVSPNAKSKVVQQKQPHHTRNDLKFLSFDAVKQELPTLPSKNLDPKKSKDDEMMLVQLKKAISKDDLLIAKIINPVLSKKHKLQSHVKSGNLQAAKIEVPGFERIKNVLRNASLIWYNRGPTPLRGDTYSFSPKEKWIFACKTIIKLLQSLQHENNVFENGFKAETAVNADILFRSYRYLANVVLSSKVIYHNQIRHYLTKSLNEDECIKYQHFITERCPFFSKYSYEQKFRFSQYLRFKKVKKGAVLIEQGENAPNIYFVLSGEIKILKSENRGDKKISSLIGFLNCGEKIIPGESDTTFQETAIQDSTLVCTADCEFLSINRGLHTFISRLLQYPGWKRYHKRFS